jgi:hypothetical protein
VSLQQTLCVTPLRHGFFYLQAGGCLFVPPPSRTHTHPFSSCHFDSDASRRGCSHVIAADPLWCKLPPPRPRPYTHHVSAAAAPLHFFTPLPPGVVLVSSTAAPAVTAMFVSRYTWHTFSPPFGLSLMSLQIKSIQFNSMSLSLWACCHGCRCVSAEVQCQPHCPLDISTFSAAAEADVAMILACLCYSCSGATLPHTCSHALCLFAVTCATWAATEAAIDALKGTLTFPGAGQHPPPPLSPLSLQLHRLS